MAPQPESEVGEVIIFQAEDGNTILEVRLDHETVRLSQDQMSELFGKERSVITKHLRNVFKEGKSEESAVRAKNAYTALDGKTYQTQFYIGAPNWVTHNGIERPRSAEPAEMRARTHLKWRKSVNMYA